MTLRAFTLGSALAGCLSAPVAQAPLEARTPSGAPLHAAGASRTASVAASFDAALLDNGAFDQAPSTFTDAAGAQRVPWWKSAAGAAQLVPDELGSSLRTAPGEWAAQPVATFGPLAAGLTVRGEVEGPGLLLLHEGAGRTMRVPVGSSAGGFEPFEVSLAQFRATLPAAAEPAPRFVLELRAAGSATVHWRRLDLRAPLPAPSRDELRAELVAELDWIFGLWLEHAADRFGPRETAFLASRFDILTGEPKVRIPGGHNVFFDLLMRAAAVHDAAHWSAAFTRFLDDFFELSFDPDTGLPRQWDVERDEPLDAPIEIAETLRFLLDVALEGPPEYRARALAAAERLGRTVLATGVLPDGRVAARYRPSDGQPNSDTVFLRQLDLPAQLGRLGAVTGDESYRDVALHALAVLEYTHVWPGTWDAIDPGFDDQYGHYGARAAVLWRAWPDDRPFRRLAYAGLGHYVPLWRDALRFGGNVAADQVRCWAIALEVAELEASARVHLAPVLADAARAHFKGEQYGNGAWGDVTHFGFDPQPHLQVGDLTGVPQNLLEGLALLHDARLAEAGGMGLEEVRARFCAVWRSSRSEYRRPFGYLATREESAGENLSLGSLRAAVGLVTLLERL